MLRGSGGRRQQSAVSVCWANAQLGVLKHAAESLAAQQEAKATFARAARAVAERLALDHAAEQSPFTAGLLSAALEHQVVAEGAAAAAASEHLEAVLQKEYLEADCTRALATVEMEEANAAAVALESARRAHYSSASGQATMVALSEATAVYETEVAEAVAAEAIHTKEAQEAEDCNKKAFLW